MISKLSLQSLLWVDLESPTIDELSYASDEFLLPDSLIAEALNKLSAPTLNVFPSLVHVVLDFPSSMQENTQVISPHNVVFVLKDKVLITLHQKTIGTLTSLSKTFEADAVKEEYVQKEHSGFLFLQVLEALHRDFEKVLHETEIAIHDIGNKIRHTKGDSQIATHISHMNNLILKYEDVVETHKGIMNTFVPVCHDFYGTSFEENMTVINRNYVDFLQTLKNQKEMLSVLETMNNSLLSAKMKRRMRVLVCIVVILSILLLIAVIK